MAAPRRHAFPTGTCMAFDLLDEHEQGELVQKWLRENAMAIVMGIVIGLGLIFGWQQWKAHGASQAAAAAAQYQALADALSAQKPDDASKVAEAIRKEYPDSTYAVLAALQQAEIAAAKNDLASAAQHLDWARGHVKLPSLRQLVDLRIGRVKLASGDAEGALKLAEGSAADDYAALAGELRGDALVKLGRIEEARKAYAAVLASDGSQGFDRTTVQMKLDDLGGSAAATEQPTT